MEMYALHTYTEITLPVLSVEGGGAVEEVFHGLLQGLVALAGALPHIQRMQENCREVVPTMAAQPHLRERGSPSLWS